MCAESRIGLLSHERLMHDRYVRLDTPDRFVEGHRTDNLALGIVNVNLHRRTCPHESSFKLCARNDYF
jgi:hypothetical protein